MVVAAGEGQKPTVEYVADGNAQESLDGFWLTQSDEQLQAIESVAMDMRRPFIRSTSAHVPEAEKKIVHDVFHIMKQMNETFDTVRKQEHRAMRVEVDERLKGSRYAWLYATENRPQRDCEAFE